MEENVEHSETPSNPPRLEGKPWSVGEAAVFLGVSERHLYRLRTTGKIRMIKMGKGRVLVPDDEVKRVAREGTE